METVSSDVQYSSGELPLQSQSFRASITSREKEGMEGGREGEGSVAFGKPVCCLNLRIDDISVTVVDASIFSLERLFFNVEQF